MSRILFCFIALVYLVHGKFTVLVNLQYYENPFNRLANGQCCQTGYATHGQCLQTCEPVVDLCIEQIYDNRCVSQVSTPVITPQKAAVIGNILGNMSNPIILNVSNWQDQFTLHLTIRDRFNGRNFKILDGNINISVGNLTGAQSEIYIKWSNYTFQYGPIIMSIKYKVFCAYGYVGPHCDVHCKEHQYECLNDNNTPYCRQGFEGFRCLHDTNECNEVHLCNDGKCVNTMGGFRCECKNNTAGTKCEQDVDECLYLPCKNGGTCTNLLGLYSCKCPNNTLGTNCESIDYCSSNCSGHGVCKDVQGVSICACDCGWTGQSCELDIDECMNQPCKNNGTCNNYPGRFSCSCPISWKGALCDVDVDECLYGPCQNKGSCTNLQGSFHCVCQTGWTGRHCETRMSETSKNPCLNNATHIIINSSFVCICGAGWAGKTCNIDIDECKVNNPCKNNGSCINTAGSYVCKCSVFWQGGNCEMDINECQGSPCPRYEKCRNKHLGYECVNCNNYNCTNEGHCINTIAGPTCNCTNDWAGEHCENRNFCKGNPCGLLNSCTNGKDGFTCHLHPCNSSPCKNGAHCTETDGYYKCNCKYGWTGNNCDVVNHCAYSPCRNNGSCNNLDTSFQCLCNKGWIGTLCQDVDFCTLLNPCKNEGRCANINSTFQCNCKRGWTGRQCQIKDHCINHPCENNGTCTNHVNGYSCDCPNSWLGNNCSVYNYCHEDPCRNGGTCVNKKDAYSCICHIGTTGDSCENHLDWCASSPCLNNGTCFNTDAGYYCRCVGGWKGRKCQDDINECLWSQCPHRSSCVNLLGGYKCIWREATHTKGRRNARTVHRRNKQGFLTKHHTINHGSSLKNQPGVDLKKIRILLWKEFNQADFWLCMKNIEYIVKSYVCLNDKVAVYPLSLQFTIREDENVALIKTICGDHYISQQELKQGFIRAAGIEQNNTVVLFLNSVDVMTNN